jgi:general secretion pathway protein K
MVSSSPRRQRGLAMLIAMLIVVIGTTIAVNVSHEEKFTIRKSAHVHLLDRAQQYAVGLEDWARIYLRKDREDSEIDSLDEDWALGIPGLPIEGGYLSGYIEDEQAKFNVNTLLNSELAVNRFRRLCDNLGVDDRFIPALMDWIDQDFEVRYPDGMEDNYETYRVANREIADISELLLVHNMTPEIYEQLKPHITALPPTTGLNLNTMSKVVFESLGEDLDAADFIEAREDSAFETVEEFIERLQVPLETEGLSVNTQFFRTYGQVVQGDQSYTVSTLIYRESEGGTSVINRTLGVL